MKSLTIKNLVTKIQKLFVNHESQPVSHTHDSIVAIYMCCIYIVYMYSTHAYFECAMKALVEGQTQGPIFIIWHTSIWPNFILIIIGIRNK